MTEDSESMPGMDGGSQPQAAMEKMFAMPAQESKGAVKESGASPDEQSEARRAAWLERTDRRFWWVMTGIIVTLTIVAIYNRFIA